MSFVGDLRHLLRGRQFRRLFTVRVTSQFGDGVFQVALASYVLFSPERQPDAASIAATLTAMLLPFSLVGPFAGVFLDRWNRRQLLFALNLFRALPVGVVAVLIATGAPEALLFATVVVAFSVNRFLLAGLSASLPRVVPRHELVLANAVTPTSGTIAYLVGLSAGSLLRQLPAPVGSDPGVVLVGACIFCVAGLLALRIPRNQLGPDLAELHPRVLAELRRVAAGLADGVRHLGHRPPAAHALGVIAVHRFCFGLTTVATILLFRNLFEPDDADAALAGLSLTVAAAGLGLLTAAVITPLATARVGPRGWILVLLPVAAVVAVFPTSLYTVGAIVLAGYGVGVVGQGLKICVDTLVQTTIDDAFRGRVFSLYDVIFNVVFVLAAAVGAAVIPPDGKSYWLLAAICALYLAAAAAYAALSRRAGSPAASRVERAGQA